MILLAVPVFSFASAATNGQQSSNINNTVTGAALAASDPSSNWLTYHNSNNKSGYTNSLPEINSPSVNWSETLGGNIYGEPLVYDGMTIVTTETDMVYALNSATGATIWSITLGTPADSFSSTYTCEDSAGTTGTPSIVPSIGITSTPVIDPATSTIYVAGLDSGVGQFLYAIDATNGHTLWSKQITASGFNYVGEEQRGALALANGFVYVPFGSYSWSCTPSFGWLFAISANGNGTTYNFRVDTQSEADIWEPEGVTVDSSGDVYVATGNSYYNATYDYGDSVLKFSPDLKLLDYFAPSNWAYIGPADFDQDTTGVTLLPGNLAFSIGKSGVGFILNTSDLGGIGGQLYSAQVCRSPAEGWPYGAWGSTSYYNGVIYVPCNSGLAALSLTSGAHPSFKELWNFTGIDAGPAIIAGGAVWEETIASPATLYALNPQTGAVLYQQTLSGSDAHFSTPAAGDGLVFVPDNSTLYAFNPATQTTSSGSSVTIESVNQAGTAITGYHTVLYNSAGSEINQGFTPTQFSTTSGQTYSIVAQSYGSCTFARWSDGVTSDPRTFTATGSSIALIAVYNCSGVSTTSSLTVDSVNQYGEPITGYRTVLYGSSGSVLSEGFTPSTFTTTTGDTYGIRAESYGSCSFSKWSDGVTSDPMTFTASASATTFTAVYDCSGTTPPPPSTSSVTVNSVNQNGAAITGYRTVLYSSSGNVISEGFTPDTYTVNVGQTYSVSAENYGSCTFSKWSNGATSDPMTFTAGSSAVTYTAQYRCGGTSTIKVTTVNGAGTTMTGFYITLWQDGKEVGSCFSTCSFTVNNGQAYQVEAASYGSETFSHWQNNGATGRETVNVPSTSTEISLVAVYSP